MRALSVSTSMHKCVSAHRNDGDQQRRHFGGRRGVIDFLAVREYMDQSASADGAGAWRLTAISNLSFGMQGGLVVSRLCAPPQYRVDAAAQLSSGVS